MNIDTLECEGGDADNLDVPNCAENCPDADVCGIASDCKDSCSNVCPILHADLYEFTKYFQATHPSIEAFLSQEENMQLAAYPLIVKDIKDRNRELAMEVFETFEVDEFLVEDGVVTLMKAGYSAESLSPDEELFEKICTSKKWIFVFRKSEY